MNAITAAVIGSSSASASLHAASAAAAAPGRGRAYLNWDARKREVLAEFTLAGKLTVAASFLQDENDEELEQATAPLSKARARLDWVPRWSLAMTLDSIVEWNRAYAKGAPVRTVTLQQISDFRMGTARAS